MSDVGPTADLAVIILTYNEELNVAHAIESVRGLAREIFIVDSYSSDRTVAIAQTYPRVQVLYHAFKDYSDQWNWAISHLPITSGWVLKLDADEAVTPALGEEIARELARPDHPVTGYLLRRRLCFLGKALRFGGFDKVWHLRLWRHGLAHFEDRPVNEQVILDGPDARLRGYLTHDDRKGLSAWVWRHNRYSTMEAEAFFRKDPGGDLQGALARRRWLKQRILPLLPCKPLIYFLYTYVFRLGFLDGASGYHLCKLGSVFYYLIELKKKEVRLYGAASSQDTIAPMPTAGAPQAAGRPPSERAS